MKPDGAPTIAVIIPTFNRAALAAEALKSVLEQTFTDFECVVVDDGSTDGTCDQLDVSDERVCLLRLERNMGVSAARNRGVAATRAPWIAFLDSDDFWHSRKLELQMEFLRAHPQLRICQTEDVWIRHSVRVNPMRKHAKGEGDCFARSLELCVISPSTVMLSRGLFEETGGFDESLPVCEDYDLWLRIACREPVGLIKEPLATRRGGHADQLSSSELVMDRFRIRAIDKLLSAGCLNAEQTQQAVAELERKCRIVAHGAEKRGKQDEAESMRQLAAKWRARD
ncbi:glycosyltransferase family 2 protein [Candidatus Sumerlaeota bacterium]|nr:glycosyltransferase family 2 protein [Candidatus Sumerlaeota bacterium]